MTGPRASTATSTVARVAREYSWVRLPIAAPIAVRLPLLLTGKPESSPPATFAAPRARNSWLASIFSPERSAKARAVSTLSE